jgi:CTP:phosphocholine cytidylyltransferase-like protein
MIRTPYHLQESSARWSGTIKMECNNEYVIQVKGIVEMKLDNFDFEGSKKYVLTTPSLFLKLESINQMLAVIKVHTVERVQVGSNEMGWYEIL